MNAKLIGGVLLIIGTSIGGGMLALPVSAAQSGFLPSSLLLFGCWVIMTFSAFLILEVNLWMPANSNLISMAKKTLGKSAAVAIWFFYLLLFYSLLAAYISSGADIFNVLLLKIGVIMPPWLAALLFVLLLGAVVYKGIESVDYVNRGLMTTKLGAYLVLVLLIIGFISFGKLSVGQPQYLVPAVTVMLTSFGYANIIPSLRDYFHGDVAKLRKTILIGSLIPLFFYILWNLAILGVLPFEGNFGLGRMLTSGHSTTDLVAALNHHLDNNWITYIARLFTSVCVATSFLGVGLALSDFLADGFNVAKTGNSGGNFLVYAMTFVPPLVIALFYPNAFIKGLSYAGIFCLILLVLFPALMVWSGRYRKQMAGTYEVMGGKSSIILTVIVAVCVIGIATYENIHGW